MASLDVNLTLAVSGDIPRPATFESAKALATQEVIVSGTVAVYIICPLLAIKYKVTNVIVIVKLTNSLLNSLKLYFLL